MNKWAQASPVITSRQLTAIIVNNNCCHTEAVKSWGCGLSPLISAGSDARLLLFPEVLDRRVEAHAHHLQVDLWPPQRPGPVHGSEASALLVPRTQFLVFLSTTNSRTLLSLLMNFTFPAWCLCSISRKYSQEETALGEAPWESAEGWSYMLCAWKKEREMGVLSLPRLREPLLYHSYFCPITELGSFS